jgi:hypothetical protein
MLYIIFKKLTIIVLVLFGIAAGVGTARGTVYLTLEEALKLAFPGADKIVQKKVWLDSKARIEIGNAARQPVSELSFRFYIGMKESKPLGYMVVDSVIGKSEPMTYMVVFAPDGSIKRVEIMVFREPQGDEVRHRAFLKQYEGKKDTDTLRVGRDIQYISGATLSTYSLTTGVTKLLAVFKYAFLGGASH